jgi:peptide/nickel transport system substrate-binding protein
MRLIKPLIAAALSFSSLFAPGYAAARTLSIAYMAGPASELPDPRARQFGWLSNQAGVTETLMGLTDKMELYPRLAESIEQIEPTAWKVVLKAGLKFHDGSAVTAQSVIDSITPISEQGHPANNPRLVKLMDLAGMEAPDDRTVIFRTKAPNAAFAWTLTEPGIVVLGAPSKEFPINATGPFIFKQAIPDQLYRAEANATYRDGAPGVSEVKVVKMADPAAAALAFEAGQIDLVINYPETDYDRIVASGAQGLMAPTTQLYWLQLNVKNGPLKDPRIRKAVDLAIDREGIITAAMSGIGGVPAGTLFPSFMPWAADIKPVYDPAKAEALLAEAGATKQNSVWMLDGKPLTINLVTYSSRAPLPPTAELIQAYLGAIGITTKVTIGEYEANNEKLASGEADMHLQAWGSAPQGDPSYFPETTLAKGAGSNIGGYDNPALDGLLKKGRETSDPADRKKIYDDVQQIIASDVALIPVFHAAQVSVFKPGLKGFSVHPAMTYWMNSGIRWEN